MQPIAFQEINNNQTATNTLAGTKIDGKEIAKSVKSRIKVAVDELKSQNVKPCLATILVGDNPASETYVKLKHRDCEEVGILSQDHRFSKDLSQSELNNMIDELNKDSNIHGILVQLPLPSGLNEFETISRVSPLKDVDGLTPHNAGLLAMDKAMLVACTPAGVMEMLDFYKIDLEGKHVVVINRSILVGKPLYHLLIRKNATVTTCHSKTKNLEEICKTADVVITAVGNRDKFTLTPDMIKEGAVVIDVATTKRDGKLVGDTEFDQIIKKASYASPVPGGVGLMTRAMLLKNTVTAASLVSQLEK